jgi:hypothetical protein
LRSERIVLALLVLASACEIEKVGIPRTEAGVSMHAVLSATAASQVVLLERTRNGSVSILGPPFDLADPLVSDEGIAESQAFVRLVTPSGETLLGREDNTVRDDGKGRGIYRFALPGSTLVRNQTYRLVIQTLAGENLAAETSVPSGVPATAATPRLFDRARDTVLLEWPGTPGARSYFVRIETPFGPRSFFTEGTQLRLTGELRNVDVDELPRVFIPGFPQDVTVSAVDSNYYDWYRSHNNTLTGTGLINRVQGGFGVFGSLVRLRFEDFHVVAPQLEPVAGRFQFVGTAEEHMSTPYSAIELYVESVAARADQPDALSGRYDVVGRFGYTGCLVCGLLGTVRDGQVKLALLSAWSARDTTEIFTGELRGDTLVGSYRGFGGIVHFVKQQ